MNELNIRVKHVKLAEDFGITSCPLFYAASEVIENVTGVGMEFIFTKGEAYILDRRYEFSDFKRDQRISSNTEDDEKILRTFNYEKYV